jgi:hypothetical protein
VGGEPFGFNPQLALYFLVVRPPHLTLYGAAQCSEETAIQRLSDFIQMVRPE